MIAKALERMVIVADDLTGRAKAGLCLLVLGCA
jgi:hypothetical protein